MSTMHYPHVGRGTTRVGTSGLRIRTHTFSDALSSNVKARGIASADWRKSKSSDSSSGDVMERTTVVSKRNSEIRPSTGSPSPVEVEMEDLAHKSIRHRPKEERAPWEMIVSAPGRAFGGSSISSSKFVCEGLPVKFKGAKPMTINVNGEEIVLENSFTFDIVTVDSDQSSSDDDSSWTTIGVLKRANSRANHHRKLSPGHDASDLPLDVQNMLNSFWIERLEDCRGPEPKQDERYIAERTRSQVQADASIDTSGGCSESKPFPSSLPQAQVSMETEEQCRYRAFLDRLNKVPVARETAERPIRDIKAADPAIVAAKVKEATKTSEDGVFGIPRLRSDWSRRAEQHSSAESDHRSFGSASSGWTLGGSSATSVGSVFSSEGVRLGGTKSLYPIKEAESKETLLEHPTKRLNPAAAEFKSTFDAKVFPISPKKMARTPLTNLFPEATQKVSANPVGPPAGREHGADQVSDGVVPRTAEASPPGPCDNLLGLASPHPPTGFGLPADGAYPTGPHGFPALPPLPLPAPFLGSLFDTYPTPTLFPPPVDLVQMHLASMNGFGTFPGTALPLPGPIPTLRVNPGAGISPVGAPVPSGLVPCPPLFGSDCKINRPNFPVTQKPRDHDPVKQQQYEQYLEWRKANEPGYHMRCKMRQAQRVVRQYQQKKVDWPTNPAWKSIVEKAKAAVSAAAEAAAAEKRKMQESVRAELMAKVRERSEDSTKSDENIPPAKLMKPVAKKVGDPFLSKSELLKPLAGGLKKNGGTRQEKSE